MTLSEFDRVHIAHVMRDGDWFSAHLLRLIDHADTANRDRLRQVYPDHVAAYEAWQRGEDQVDDL